MPCTRTYRSEGWTHQLIQVVFNPGQVGQRTDGHQATQGKVKQLVAEEGYEPAVTVLKKIERKEKEAKEIY